MRERRAKFPSMNGRRFTATSASITRPQQRSTPRATNPEYPVLLESAFAQLLHGAPRVPATIAHILCAAIKACRLAGSPCSFLSRTTEWTIRARSSSGLPSSATLHTVTQGSGLLNPTVAWTDAASQVLCTSRRSYGMLTFRRSSGRHFCLPVFISPLLSMLSTRFL